MLKKPALVATLTLVLMVMFTAPVAAAEDGASAVVRNFQNAMLRTMKQTGSDDVQGRYRLMLPVIGDSFHLPLMVRITTGPYWATIGKAQRQRLVKEFHRMSTSSLVTFLGTYEGERFEIVRERAGTRTTVMVDTRVLRPGRDSVEISYVVGHYGPRWRIVDVVVAGGISELAVRRSEYAGILKAGGADALIKALSGTADRVLAGKRDKAQKAVQR